MKQNYIKFVKKKNIPLLGVCRGMQVINLLEGGKIHKIRNHVSKIHNLKLKKNLLKNIYYLKLTHFMNTE